MFDGKQTVHVGEGWKSVTDQYSNKGPVILVENDKGEELFRVLYDVVTKRLKLIIHCTGKTIEAKLL